MEKVLEILNWVVASGPNLIAAVMAVLVALIALFALIPGEQPEKALQGVVDFISKFSLKKKE
jgi:hypothetical protein